MWNPGQRLVCLETFYPDWRMPVNFYMAVSKHQDTDICFFENFCSKWLGSFCEVSCELCHITALYWSKPNLFPAYGGYREVEHSLESSNNRSNSFFSCISHRNYTLILPSPSEKATLFGWRYDELKEGCRGLIRSKYNCSFIRHSFSCVSSSRALEEFCYITLYVKQALWLPFSLPFSTQISPQNLNKI